MELKGEVMSKDNPCYGCPERTITCHIDCEKHEKWKIKHLKEKEQIYQKRRADFLYRYDRTKLFRKMDKKKHAPK